MKRFKLKKQAKEAELDRSSWADLPAPESPEKNAEVDRGLTGITVAYNVGPTRVWSGTVLMNSVSVVSTSGVMMTNVGWQRVVQPGDVSSSEWQEFQRWKRNQEELAKEPQEICRPTRLITVD